VAFSGSLTLAEAAAAAHGIKVQDSDIILQSRPDLLFSHTLDFQHSLGLGRNLAIDSGTLCSWSGTMALVHRAKAHQNSSLLQPGGSGHRPLGLPWHFVFVTLVRKSHMPWDFDFEVPKGNLAYSTVSKCIGYQGRTWGYMLVHAATCMGVSVDAGLILPVRPPGTAAAANKT
jgi:hypothetical protein